MLHTKKEIAALLKVCLPTVDKWRKEGLPCIKRGRNVRFDFKKVVEWLEGKK